MFIKALNEEIAMITVIPSWLRPAEILPSFEKTMKKLSKYFTPDMIYDRSELPLMH